MKPLIAILILLVAGVATAQPLVLTRAPGDGVYVLTVQGGAVTGFERALVIIPDGPVPPPIVIPPITDPTSLSSLTTVSQAEYVKIPAGTSKQIMGITVSTVYRKIATDLRTGSINVAQAAEHLTSIRAALPDEWAAWRTATSATWNALQDKGQITSASTWAAAAEAVADGVAPPGAAEDFVVDSDEFLDNPLIGPVIDMLIKMLGDSDRPIAKWLPLILAIVKIFLGGL